MRNRIVDMIYVTRRGTVLWTHFYGILNIINLFDVCSFNDNCMNK